MNEHDQLLFEKAKGILEQSSSGYTFQIAEMENVFPPLDILNDFLRHGRDAADQDGMMGKWSGFELSREAYNAVWNWWLAFHPTASIGTDFKSKDCNGWFAEAIEDGESADGTG